MSPGDLRKKKMWWIGVGKKIGTGELDSDWLWMANTGKFFRGERMSSPENAIQHLREILQKNNAKSKHYISLEGSWVNILSNEWTLKTKQSSLNNVIQNICKRLSMADSDKPNPAMILISSPNPASKLQSTTNLSALEAHRYMAKLLCSLRALQRQRAHVLHNL